MKIVYLLENPGGGGAEEYILNLALEARESGHEVCFVFGSDEGLLVDKVRDNHFDLSVIPMKSSFDPTKVTSSLVKLKKYISEYKPDIIHTQMLREQSLVIGAKLFGAKVKLVRTFHRLDQFNGKMKPLMPLYRKYTDGYIAINEYMKEHLADNGIKRNVYVIHNGATEVNPRQKKKSLGYLGRLTDEKGIKSFVTANAKLLADVSFSIGGDGEEKVELEKLVAKNNLKAKLYGQITDKDAFFASFNVLVLPSVTEALPLVVLEAFSAGTPVVSFDLPSLRTLVDGENGILVKQGDYKKLAKVAIELMNSKNYKKYSEQARETYLHGYTITKMWYDTERLYAKIKAK